jgi:hypothetical protein
MSCRDGALATGQNAVTFTDVKRERLIRRSNSLIGGVICLILVWLIDEKERISSGCAFDDFDVFVDAGPSRCRRRYLYCKSFIHEFRLNYCFIVKGKVIICRHCRHHSNPSQSITMSNVK